MFKKIFLILLSFSAGIITAVFILNINSKVAINSSSIKEILYSPLPSLSQRKQVIGFLPYWLISQTQPSYTNLITNLTYFGLTIGPDGHLVKLLNPQEEEPGWTTFKQDRLQNIFTKAQKDKIDTSLLIFTSNEEDISNIINSSSISAKNLMTDIIPLMKTGGFNSLNLDIESFQEASLSTQLKYAEFLQEIKKILSENNINTLTVDITPESLIKPRLTNLSLISQIADYIVLMTYDYHYLHSLLTGPVAPIGGANLIREYDVETAIKLALEKIPAEKIILGVPLYGYEWETLTPQPIAGVIPNSGKVASVKKISKILSSCSQCLTGVEETSQEPYLIIPEGLYFRQIFYENQESLTKKLALVKKYHLGGMALWALGYEDNTILTPLRSFH